MLTLVAALTIAAGPNAMDNAFVQQEFGQFHSNGESAFLNNLSGRFATGWLAFELDVPFAVTTGPVGSVVMGNVGLRALGRIALASSTQLEGGLGFAFGTAEATTIGDAGTYLIASAMTGMRDFRAMAPNAASVYVPIRFESSFSSGFFIRNRLSADLLFRTDDIGVDSIIQLTWRGGPGFRSGFFEGSVNFSAAGFFDTGESGRSDAQVALIPQVRVYSSPRPLQDGAVYGQAAFNLNLDEPHGFSFDEGRVWGLFLAVGYVFPKLFSGPENQEPS